MQAVIGCKDTKSKAAEPRAAGARPLADSAPAPGIPALNPEATEPPPVPGDSGLETGATEHGDSALIVYFADTFSDEGDANQTQSSLSCRDEILRRVGPKNDSTPGRYRSRLSKATLLQKGGCLEFLPPRNQYALFLRPDSVSAFWKPVDPDIEIEASIKDVVCDQGKYTHLDFSISLPGGRDTSFILFASTDIPRSQDPVPWSEWKWTGGYESFPKLDSARLPRIDTLRLVGFGKTWFPEVWLESRYAWGGGSEEVKRVVREQVALKARLPNGVTLVIASESADSGYSYGDAEIRSVKATDLDGDGNPEFILELSDGSQVLVGVRGGAVDRVITLERGSDRMLSGC